MAKIDWKDPAEKREYLRERWYELRDKFVACFEHKCQCCGKTTKVSRSWIILLAKRLPFKKLAGLTLLCRSCVYKKYPAHLGGGSSRRLLMSRAETIEEEIIRLGALHYPEPLSRQSVELSHESQRQAYARLRFDVQLYK